MRPFTTLISKAVPLPLSNIDTDVIIPIQCCTVVDDSGFANGFFHNLRFRPDGSEIADCVFNQPRYAGAEVLIAGDNFGCGSSREHAPWAMRDYGIRCIIAPSFADIFYQNCFKIGLLPLTLDQASIDRMIAEADGGDNRRMIVDLEGEKLTTASGRELPIRIDPARRRALLDGIDDLELTLRCSTEISGFERRSRDHFPWLQADES